MDGISTKEIVVVVKKETQILSRSICHDSWDEIVVK